MNPPVGGIPAWARRKNASSAAISGPASAEGPEVVDRVAVVAGRRATVTIANAPIVMNEYTSR